MTRCTIQECKICWAPLRDPDHVDTSTRGALISELELDVVGLVERFHQIGVA